MVRPARILGILTAGVLAAHLLAATSTFAADDQATQTALLFQSSMNAHDIEGTANLFVEDAVVMQPRVGGLPESYVGQAQIHWWLRNMVAQHLHVDLAGAPHINGSHLSWSDNFSADAFRQLGLEVVGVDAAVELASDDRIESLRLTFTPDAVRSLQLAPVVAQPTGSGDSTFDGQAAEVVMALLLLGLGVGAGALLSVRPPAPWR